MKQNLHLGLFAVIIPRQPENETLRVALLHKLDLLDTPPEEEFDRITRLAARTLQMPITLISLLDSQRQWFKSRHGLAMIETSRDVSFSGHAILGESALVISDAQTDMRFHDNPLVSGPPHIRFYAGQPLRSRQGLPLGTLCLIDCQPRELNASDRQTLADLARIAEQALHARELATLSRKLHVDSQHALYRQEALYRETFEQAPVGIAHITIDGHWLTANPCLIDLLGYPREVLFKQSLRDLIDEADWNKLESQSHQLLSGQVNDFQQEIRFRNGNGHRFWGNLTIALHRSDHGQAEHFILIIESIELRKAADAAVETIQQGLEQRVLERTVELANARQELVTITDHLPILIAYIDRKQRYRFVNAVYSAWYGVDHHTLIGKQAHSLLDAQDQMSLMPYLEKVMQGMTVKFNARYRFNGTLRDVHFTIVPDEDAQHQVRGYYQMVQDITQLTRLMEQLHDQAFADALTGLPNRRAILEQIKAAIARQKRQLRPVAALFLDLDGFKSINDRFGHDVGDELLKQFAQRLKACVRQTDIVARLAGDEFTILLESLTEPISNATTVAGKIIEAMASPFKLGDRMITISTSIGIAIRDVTDTGDGDALLSQADEAMYLAKRSGKNCYAFA